MKRIVLAIVVFGLCSSAGMAQNKASDEGPITRLVLPEDRAREAMIDATYPVTPGGPLSPDIPARRCTVHAGHPGGKRLFDPAERLWEVERSRNDFHAGKANH